MLLLDLPKMGPFRSQFGELLPGVAVSTTPALDDPLPYILQRLRSVGIQNSIGNPRSPRAITSLPFSPAEVTSLDAVAEPSWNFPCLEIFEISARIQSI